MNAVTGSAKTAPSTTATAGRTGFPRSGNASKPCMEQHCVLVVSVLVPEGDDSGELPGDRQPFLLRVAGQPRMVMDSREAVA